MHEALAVAFQILARTIGTLISNSHALSLRHRWSYFALKLGASCCYLHTTWRDLNTSSACPVCAAWPRWPRPQGRDISGHADSWQQRRWRRTTAAFGRCVPVSHRQCPHEWPGANPGASGDQTRYGELASFTAISYATYAYHQVHGWWGRNR